MLVGIALDWRKAARGPRYNRFDHIVRPKSMRSTPSRAARIALVAALGAAVAACGSFDRTTRGIASLVTPYKVEIVQGNFVSREQVAALKQGMSRLQVRDVLGTPLLTDAFHADRWDYVFTIRRQGVQPQERRFAVFFKGDALDHWQGDDMPSEADFVATLDTKRKGAAIPPLEASEDKLKQFAAENKPAPAPAAPPPAPATASYPPLEPQR
jgi:outer membrane protein assembly factor BamE